MPLFLAARGFATHCLPLAHPAPVSFEENNWLLTVYDFLKREQISDIPSFQDDHSQN